MQQVYSFLITSKRYHSVQSVSSEESSGYPKTFPMRQTVVPAMFRGKKIGGNVTIAISIVAIWW
jgi:hypothetical protein